MFHLVSAKEEVILPSIEAPDNIAPTEKPDKKQAIENIRTRFVVV